MKNNGFKLLMIFHVLYAIAFLGCAQTEKSIDEKMLIGKYCFTNRNNKDSLFLYADRSYHHKYSTSQQKVFESKGIWNYDSLFRKITFEDFIFFSEEGADNPPGIWHSIVDITKENEVRLMYAPEHKMFYYKK